MINILKFSCLVLLLLAVIPHGASAHTIHYQVDETGISARVFFSADEPAAYSEYEIFGPGDQFPHQRGRSDRNGFVAFLPDRPGTWRIDVEADSSHGPHPLQIEIEVEEGLFLTDFKKPLVATHLNIFIALGAMGWLFGLWAIYALRRQKNVRNGSKDAL